MRPDPSYSVENTAMPLVLKNEPFTPLSPRIPYTELFNNCLIENQKDKE
jgi:hypothetical protein